MYLNTNIDAIIVIYWAGCSTWSDIEGNNNFINWSFTNDGFSWQAKPCAIWRKNCNPIVIKALILKHLLALVFLYLNIFILQNRVDDTMRK